MNARLESNGLLRAVVVLLEAVVALAVAAVAYVWSAWPLSDAAEALTTTGWYRIGLVNLAVWTVVASAGGGIAYGFNRVAFGPGARGAARAVALGAGGLVFAAAVMGTVQLLVLRSGF